MRAIRGSRGPGLLAVLLLTSTTACYQDQAARENGVTKPAKAAVEAKPATTGPSATAQPTATVQVQVVNYDGLKNAVKQLRGKVVVVDCWSLTWLSCIKEFPHLVQVQEKYAKDGLAAVSVSLDNPNEKDTKEKVLNFLQSKKAIFTNLILDEKEEDWQKKLDIDGPPAVFIFGRDGQKLKEFKEGVDYEEVEKAVQGYLKEDRNAAPAKR